MSDNNNEVENIIKKVYFTLENWDNTLLVKINWRIAELFVQMHNSIHYTDTW